MGKQLYVNRSDLSRWRSHRPTKLVFEVLHLSRTIPGIKYLIVDLEVDGLSANWAHPTSTDVPNCDNTPEETYTIPEVVHNLPALTSLIKLLPKL